MPEHVGGSVEFQVEGHVESTHAGPTGPARSIPGAPLGTRGARMRNNSPAAEIIVGVIFAIIGILIIHLTSIFGLILVLVGILLVYSGLSSGGIFGYGMEQRPPQNPPPGQPIGNRPSFQQPQAQKPPQAPPVQKPPV